MHVYHKVSELEWTVEVHTQEIGKYTRKVDVNTGCKGALLYVSGKLHSWYVKTGVGNGRQTKETIRMTGWEQIYQWIVCQHTYCCYRWFLNWQTLYFNSPYTSWTTKQTYNNTLCITRRNDVLISNRTQINESHDLGKWYSPSHQSHKSN